MRSPLPLRRWIGGMPGLLFAGLLLLTRLLVPAAAMPEADRLAALGLQTICHAGAHGATAPAGHDAPSKGHGDCRLCPACHMVAQPALAVAAASFDLSPAAVRTAAATRAEGSTGPPPRSLAAGHPPTGPPAASV